MTTHTYRVSVRGKFDQLTDVQRAQLLGAVDDHSLLKGGFTPEGSLTYDRDLLAFTFRYELSASGENGEREVIREAQERAAATLTANGYPYRDLRSSAVDMHDIKVRRPRHRS